MKIVNHDIFSQQIIIINLDIFSKQKTLVNHGINQRRLGQS